MALLLIVLQWKASRETQRLGGDQQSTTPTNPEQE